MLTSIVVFLLFSIVFIFWKYSAVSLSRVWMNKNSSFFLNRLFAGLFPIIILSLLIGLRYDVGVDYLAYKEIYETRFDGNLIDSIRNSDLEILYTIISYYCYQSGMPYYIFFVVMAFIPLVFYYKSFKYFTYLFPYSFYCIVSFGVLFWYFNIQRQAIAFFILLYSIKYIVENKKFIFLLCCLIAVGFHLSSLYFIPFIFLFYLPRRPLFSPLYLVGTYILTWICSNHIQSLLFFIIRPFLSGRYLNYEGIMENWIMEGGSGIGLLLLHIIDIIFILNSPFLFKRFSFERFDIYFRLYYTGCIIANIAGLNMLLSRLPFSFISIRSIVGAFFLYYVFNCWKSLKWNIQLSFVIVVCFSALLLIANIINTPYQFVFID